MSGIYGLWNLDGRPADRDLLARMGAALAHRGPDGGGLWIEGPVGLGCRLLRVTPESAAETQPLVTPTAVVVFDGRLDDREELLAGLGDAGAAVRTLADPELVAAAHRALGEAFAGRLAGDFALAVFDPGRSRLILARDALGVRPLYYCRTGSTFLFASEIKAILAHPGVVPRPDDEALAATVLDGGRCPQGATCFRGIHSLPPAHLAELTPHRLVLRRYWDFDTGARIRLGSFREYVEAFRERFERAVRRRLRSAHPVAVSVSGGLDSSSILCQALALGRGEPGRHPPVIGISYTSPEGYRSDEKGYLAEIEEAHGVRIERFPKVPVGPLDGSAEAVWHTETPLLDEQWGTSATFFRTARELGARVVLTGHWGDQVLFPQAYLVDLLRRLAWGTLREHLGQIGRWYTDLDPGVFRRRFLLDLAKYHLPPALLPWFRRLLSAPPRPWYTEAFVRRGRRRRRGRPPRGAATVHARSLYEEVRSDYYVLCMEWNNKVACLHGVEIAFPFLDRDLVAFLMAIPGEVQTYGGVPKALLREAMEGVLPEAIRLRRWKADSHQVVNEGMEADYPRLLRYLGREPVATRLGYVRGEVVRRELGRLREGLREPDCAAAWRLSELLGLEVWLRVFFGEGMARTAT